MTERQARFGDGWTTSITARLTAAIALILVSGGVAVTLAALEYGRQAAEEAYDRLLAGAAFQISRSVSVVDGEIVVDLPVSAFELLALAPNDRVAYRLMDSQTVTITGRDDVPPPPSESRDTVYYSTKLSGETYRLASIRRQFVERAYVGDVIIIVGHTIRARSALAWDIAQNALLIVLIAGVVLVALTIFAVRSALQPLRRIEGALLARDPKDLSPLEVTAPHEVKTMIAAIDRFMARLSRRVTVMQNLIADATHQLRTPIAALRAQAELATGENDPDRLRAIAARIHNRAVGLSRLTDQLLNQALVIHRSDTAEQNVIDLRAVVMLASEDTDHDMLSSGTDLRLDFPENPVYVRGDALSLGEATKNLINNAFRYGAPPVLLTVRSAPTSEISVTDHGPGIPESDWPDSGRRFARVAGSVPGSAGLGLAIVNAVAEAHSGHLEFSRNTDGHFVATLKLPPASEDTP